MNNDAVSCKVETPAMILKMLFIQAFFLIKNFSLCSKTIQYDAYNMWLFTMVQMNHVFIIYLYRLFYIYHGTDEPCFLYFIYISFIYSFLQF